MRLLPLVLLTALAVSGCSGSSSDSDSATGDSATLDDGSPSAALPIDSADPASDITESTSAEGETAAIASDVSDEVSTSPVEPIPDPMTPVAPQSGILTAGDYDDQLNPLRYQTYSRNAQQNFPADAQVPALSLDPDERVQLQVVDANGNPQARANVQVQTINGENLNLHTAADGTVWLYPEMDALPSVLDVSIQNPSGDVQVQQLIDTADMGAERLNVITLPAAGTPITELDLALVIDTTGSMGDELDYLKAELTDILTALTDANPTVSIRVALVPYRDEGDQYVVRTYPFTSNIAEAQNSLNGESFAGGGDYPEAMDQAMQAMLNLDWRAEAISVSLLVADAPPHANRMDATWQTALAARSEMIHVVPVAASGVADEAEYIMRAMAAVTQGRYLFLTDDSGVGNSHAEPTIDCYLVTRLDGLIRRVVQSLLTGERVEPEASEVLRQVGNYDNGVCTDQ